MLQSRTETIRYETKNRLNDKIKLPHLHLLSGIAEIWLFSPRRMEMRWIACDMTLVCIKVYLFELMLLLFFFFFFAFAIFNLTLFFIFIYIHLTWMYLYLLMLLVCFGVNTVNFVRTSCLRFICSQFAVRRRIHLHTQCRNANKSISYMNTEHHRFKSLEFCWLLLLLLKLFFYYLFL